MYRNFRRKKIIIKILAVIISASLTVAVVSAIVNKNFDELRKFLLGECSDFTASTETNVSNLLRLKISALNLQYNKIYVADTEELRNALKNAMAGDEIILIKADANDLPFAHEFFNAIICADSYNYFGRDDNFLDEKIIPFIKPGGYVYIAVPGMKKDCHDDLPDELLLSWNEEQLDYIHDMDYWRNIVDKSNKSKVISIKQMEGNEELWTDWINCDNEYAAGDKKAVDAGACKYLNFISIVLQRVK